MVVVRVAVDPETAVALGREYGPRVEQAIRKWLPVAGQRVRDAMFEAGRRHFKRPTGALNASLRYVVTGDAAVVAPTVEYARWVYNGRGEVRPKRGRFLRFEVGGRTVFTTHARAFPGYPIRQEAADEAAPVVAEDLRTILGREFAG